MTRLIDGYLFPVDEDGHLSPPWVGKLMAGASPEQWTALCCGNDSPTGLTADAATCAVQTLLGHSSLATTERHTAVDDEIRAAMISAVTL